MATTTPATTEVREVRNLRGEVTYRYDVTTVAQRGLEVVERRSNFRNVDGSPVDGMSGSTWVVTLAGNPAEGVRNIYFTRKAALDGLNNR